MKYHRGRQSKGRALEKAAADGVEGAAGRLRREQPLLYTNDEAAALLNIGRTTLYQLVWSGRLTPLRIGRAVRFTREQLQTFVAELARDTPR